MPQPNNRLQLAQNEGSALAVGAEEHGTGATHAVQGHAGHHQYQLGDIPAPGLLFMNGLLVALIMIGFGVAATRRLVAIPTVRSAQNLGEFIVEVFQNFCRGIIGPGGEKYAPFIGTLFFFIYLSNLIGLIPGLHAPTSNLSTTLALGLIVFFYVQYIGIRSNGIGGYLKHFAGPMPVMAPLMFTIEVISELVRPFTLALRLFGNIFGEDTVIIALAGLAVTVLPKFIPPVIPLQFPILLLALITTFVQALVFTLLSTIYISLVTHHEEGHAAHGHEPAHEHA